MGGLDGLIADGLVDEKHMGVTGGSYGGYLTSWVIGHTDRFAAAVSCRFGQRPDLRDAYGRH
jgi:dipeptidyl aminopeptidase/acylaminoacyl peptidase